MVRITTVSGSVYLIDPSNKQWSRVAGPSAAPLRTDGGEYYRLSAYLGRPLQILAAPLDPTCDIRWIRSTPVRRIEAA